MPITGIESLVFGVEDVAKCERFMCDYGLRPLARPTEGQLLSELEVESGARVVIRSHSDPSLPKSALVGFGVREVVWGVDTEASLSRLLSRVGWDRKVFRDPDGTAHFLTDCGLPVALRVWRSRPVLSAPDPVNAPGAVNRVNTHRKWRKRARPKTIQHVVFNATSYESDYRFFCDRLDFRISDVQKDYGAYLRADGAINHHNLLLLNASLPLPGFDGQPRFNHANFGVEDVDEIMIGANHMERRGWGKSHLGLGRHRIDSALFYYLPSPTGGEVEYGADGDYLDDSWVPRFWENPLFGYLTFAHNMPPFFLDEPAWGYRYLESNGKDV